MSDFFEQILSRSFAAEATVRPRQPARFEAEGRGLSRPEDLNADAEPAGDFGRPDSDAASRTARRREGDDEREDRREDEREEPRTRRGTPPPPPSLAPQLLPMTVVRTSTEDAAAPSTSKRDDGRRVPSEKAAAVRPRPDSEEERARTPLQNEPEVRAQRRQPSEPERADTAAPPAAETRRDAPPAIVPRAAQPAPEAPPRDARRATNSHVVQVNIGRIEVNAPAQPARPPQRRTPPAPLRPAHSLDEYLRRREGGGR